MVEMEADDGRSADRKDRKRPSGPGNRPRNERCQRDDRRRDEAARHGQFHLCVRQRQPITAPTNRFDQRIGTKRREREAQAANMDIDRALFDVDMVAPHVIE